MKRLVVRSWLLLLYVDYLMRFREFRELHSAVREQPVKGLRSSRRIASEQVCRSVDLACVFYFKRVLCLQRSSATTILLRSHGWTAELVIGAQLVPFKSHAWCELDGLVINDKPYVPQTYQVLERC